MGGAADRPRVRIVVCDASAAYAEALVRYLEHDPAIEVVGSVANPDELASQVGRLRPDLVIADVGLAGRRAVRAIQRVMRERPLPILVLSDTDEGRRCAAAALAAGALEVAGKSSINVRAPGDVWATAFRSRVKRLASVRVAQRPGPQRVDGPAPSWSEREARVVAIGTSTGGPPALATVLAALPAAFAVPVLVVQHIAVGFTEGLVSWLAGSVAPPVRFATAGAPLAAGIWFAPDDVHLGLDASLRFSLDATTQRGPHRPSVDMLFESVAAAVGEHAVGVVLTGMGRDGARGVAAIRGAGGLVIAQDEDSSAVFGMPRAAIDAGADLVLPLRGIAAALAALRSSRTLP